MVEETLIDQGFFNFIIGYLIVLEKLLPPIRKRFCDYSDEEFLLLTKWIKLSSYTAISLDFNQQINTSRLDQLRNSSIRLDRIRFDKTKFKNSKTKTLSKNQKLEFWIFTIVQFINLVISAINPHFLPYSVIGAILITFSYIFLFVDIYINRSFFRYMEKRSIVSQLKLAKKNTKNATRFKCYNNSIRTPH